ncbi:MAG: isopentenyl transferase family protein, partial [Bacteroidota bacterium]
MSSPQNKTVLILAGPTAVGKTAVAIKLAEHFVTEIISADSRQCFEELNIGVARPSKEELQQVKHNF